MVLLSLSNLTLPKRVLSRHHTNQNTPTYTYCSTAFPLLEEESEVDLSRQYIGCKKVSCRATDNSVAMDEKTFNKLFKKVFDFFRVAFALIYPQ